jgi:hypothetical protein
MCSRTTSGTHREIGPWRRCLPGGIRRQTANREAPQGRSHTPRLIPSEAPHQGLPLRVRGGIYAQRCHAEWVAKCQRDGVQAPALAAVAFRNPEMAWAILTSRMLATYPLVAYRTQIVDESSDAF